MGDRGRGPGGGRHQVRLVEVAETRFPLFFKRHEFRPDSAGDGQFRGGVGSVLELRMETTEPALGNTAGDGVRHPAYGVLGGQDGLPHRYRMIVARQDARAQDQGGRHSDPAGRVFLVESMGGGGYGPPAKRSAEARAADRVNGFVSGRSRAAGEA